MRGGQSIRTNKGERETWRVSGFGNHYLSFARCTAPFVRDHVNRKIVFFLLHRNLPSHNLIIYNDCALLRANRSLHNIDFPRNPWYELASSTRVLPNQKTTPPFFMQGFFKLPFDIQSLRSSKENFVPSTFLAAITSTKRAPYLRLRSPQPVFSSNSGKITGIHSFLLVISIYRQTDTGIAQIRRLYLRSSSKPILSYSFVNYTHNSTNRSSCGQPASSTLLLPFPI